MLRYQVAGYRPAGIPVHRPQMGQTGGVRVAVGFSSLIVGALGAGTTWIGLRSAQRERGTTKKVVSYSVAVFGALVALSGVTGFIGSIASPILSGKPAQA